MVYSQLLVLIDSAKRRPTWPKRRPTWPERKPTWPERRPTWPEQRPVWAKHPALIDYTTYVVCSISDPICDTPLHVMPMNSY